MQKSYQEIFTFIAIANAWMQEHPAESKFRYALNRVLKRAAKMQADYQEAVEEINIDNCSVDEKGIILRETPAGPDRAGEYRFTKDGLKARNKARTALFRSTVEIEAHLAKAEDIPELTLEERDYFTGFVLREEASAATGD